MPGISVHVPAAAVELTPFDQKEMAATRMKRRVYDILNKAAQKSADRYAADIFQDVQHYTVQSTCNSEQKAAFSIAICKLSLHTHGNLTRVLTCSACPIPESHHVLLRQVSTQSKVHLQLLAPQKTTLCRQEADAPTASAFLEEPSASC